MTDLPLIITQRIPLRDAWTRKARVRTVERNVGKKRELKAGDPRAGTCQVEAVLFVPRFGRRALPGEYMDGVGAEAPRSMLGWLPPREVQLVVRVLSAPAHVRRELERLQWSP